MDYKILQVKDFRNCTYMFVNYDRAVKYGFNLDDYEVIYEGDIEASESIEDTLENLFYIFNVMHPEDFTGHSLSVSDVVYLDGNYYYVDSFGYKKL